MNSKWEAELSWPLSMRAWWRVSYGTSIGQASKIIFPERSKSLLSRNREIRQEIARKSAARFIPLSFLIHKKEIQKIYRWHVWYLHGNETLLCFLSTAGKDSLSECEEKVTKVNVSTNSHLFSSPAPSLLGPMVWWWRAQIPKLNNSGLTLVPSHSGLIWDKPHNLS